MKASKLFFVLIFTTVISGFTFYQIQSDSLGKKIILPSEVKWIPNPSLHGGLENAILDGDPQKEGMYSIRVRIPANTKLNPHWHPENRTVVVISGTFYWNYGEKFEESKLKEMPPGTFFTEPSKTPHFAWAKKDEVILHVTGWGPTGTTYLDQDIKK